MPKPNWTYAVTRGLALLVALATAFSTPAARQQTADELVALQHAMVIDGTGAPAAPDQTVLIAGGRITAVGASHRVTIPRGARIIDATGRFVIPGLWDTHVHTRYEGIDHLRLLVAHGITSARNMSGPWAHLAELRRWREQIESGERAGPGLLTAGPVFDGPGAGRATTVVVESTEEAGQAVRRVKRERADFVKVYNLLSRDAFMAIAAEARQQGLPVVGHIPFAVAADQASDAGLRSIEHLDAILWAVSTQEEQIRQRLRDWRPRPGVPTTPFDAAVIAASFSADKLRKLATRLAANQTVVVPTLSLYWNRVERRNERSLVTSADRLRYLPPAYAQVWRQAESPTSAQYDTQMLGLALGAVRDLHRGGVRMLAGTDVGTAFQVPGFSLHDELSLLVTAGLSEMEALQSATLNPARAFLLAERGTIENGKRADLILLDANPLEAIDNIRKIRAVVAGGRLFERPALDAMLADVENAAREWKGVPTR